MPRYAFKCTKCEYEWEEDMKLSNFTSVLSCHKCQGHSKISYKPIEFQLKGSGWESDGYVTKGSLKDYD